MSSYIFQKIAKEGDAAGVESGSIESRDWFRDQALTVGRVNVQQEMTNRARLHNRSKA